MLKRLVAVSLALVMTAGACAGDEPDVEPAAEPGDQEPVWTT